MRRCHRPASALRGAGDLMRRVSRSLVRGAAALGALVVVSGAANASAAAPALRVDGNRLSDSAGRPLRLLGVDRGALDSACTYGAASDGPLDARSITAMRSWGSDVVRLPLNQDCWLGAGKLPMGETAGAYRDRVVTYVKRLHAAGFVVVLDNQFAGVGAAPSVSNEGLPDADALTFLSSLARRFASDPAVIFDVYNEPHLYAVDGGNGVITDATAPWDCWRDGCRLRSASGVAYTGVGMQAMVKAVRAGGARRQPIMLGGLDYAGDLSQWLSHRPRDAAAALVASLHLYEFVPGSYLGGEGRPRPADGTETPEQARSARLAAWDAVIAPVAERVPVVAGEFGEYDCTSDFSAQWLDWASGHGVSALAWVWNAVDTDADGMADGHWFCDGRSDLGRGGPALIERYDGTPTAFGAGVRAGFCATRAAQGVQPAACPALPAGPRLRVARSARLSTAQTSGLTMRVGCERACRYAIIVTQRGERIGRRTGSLDAAGTRTTSVRLSRRARRGTLLIKAIFSATGITPRSLTATAALQR